MRDLTCIKHGYCKIIRDYFTDGICCGAKYCVQIIEKKMEQNRGTKSGTIDSSFAQKRNVFKKEWIKTLHTAIYVE